MVNPRVSVGLEPNMAQKSILPILSRFISDVVTHFFSDVSETVTFETCFKLRDRYFVTKPET